MKKDRLIGVTNARYINIFARLCKFACVTPRDIVDTFNELRRSLSKGELTASAPSSSPSRRPKGRRGNIALQDGSGYRENYDRPCTWEPGEKQCWLMSELEPWNRLLSRTYVELQEHSWGELTMRGYSSPKSSIPQASDALRSSLLMHVLLQQHRRVAHAVGLRKSCLSRIAGFYVVNYTLEQIACNLYCSTPDLDLLTMFNAIRELGASSRIDVDWYEPLPSYVAQFGGLCRISTLLLDLANCSAEDAKNLLEPLVSATNITKVGIECDEPVGHAVVEQLVDALCKTKAVSVLRSLEQNRSISELDVGGMTFNRRSAKALARLVEHNRTLNKIFVNVDEEDCGGCPQIRTVCRELKEAMPRNRFLTTVAVNSLSGNCASDIVIKEALRRNRMLVNQAVHFVKGSDSKKDALAFETLQHSRTVVRQLCKDSGDPDEASARGKIDKARRRLTFDYFIFTGVVKDKIACRPHSKRKPGFDKLDKHVQAHICSYLSLTDVMDV
ncbi:hypothetical protein V5799_026372 [Amblyomma americanum]|uniref:Ran gtpase-activating protein n=1 Tax=Amblyomma americanum TaxID=6943 RepID=A0AAQ4DIS1_AMBAM